MEHLYAPPLGMGAGSAGPAQLQDLAGGAPSSSPWLAAQLSCGHSGQRANRTMSWHRRTLNNAMPLPPGASRAPVVTINDGSRHCQCPRPGKPRCLRSTEYVTHPESITGPGQGPSSEAGGRERAPVEPALLTRPSTFPQPPWLGCLCSSEMGPAFAQAATGFSRLAAHS